jgi:hypothetical protein
MSKLFKPKAIIFLLWTGAVAGFFALLGSSLTLASGSLLLFVAVMPPTILLVLWTAPPLTLSEIIAQELHPADRRRAE